MVRYSRRRKPQTTGEISPSRAYPWLGLCRIRRTQRTRHLLGRLRRTVFATTTSTKIAVPLRHPNNRKHLRRQTARHPRQPSFTTKKNHRKVLREQRHGTDTGVLYWSYARTAVRIRRNHLPSHQTRLPRQRKSMGAPRHHHRLTTGGRIYPKLS